MENALRSGYITEKLLYAFISGAIPIYKDDLGTVGDRLNFNPKAYINISKFKTLDEAANYIVELSNDPKRIEKMRNEPIFKDNKVPDIFYVGKDKDNLIIQKDAKRLRKLYMEYISRKPLRLF